MVDHGLRCEQCGTLTMTFRFGLGEALERVDLCLQCVTEAKEELEHHGATCKHAEIGGES